MAYCPVCGTEEAPGQNFCARCGSPTPSSGSPSSRESSPVSPTPSAPPSQNLPPYPGASSYPSAPVYQGATTPGLQIASFWWRVLAFIVDELVLEFVLLLALRNVSISYTASVTILIIVNFLYFGLMVGLVRGQTIGMMICRLRVVNAADRAPVTLTQAMWRSALYCALLLVASIYRYRPPSTSNLTAKQETRLLHHALIYFALAVPHLLDLLWAAWDKQRQTLHDKLGKTIVIRTR